MAADIQQVLERATPRPWPKQMNTHCYRDGIERTKEQFDADYELMHAAVNSFESNRELIASMKGALTLWLDSESRPQDSMENIERTVVDRNAAERMARVALERCKELGL